MLIGVIKWLIYKKSWFTVDFIDDLYMLSFKTRISKLKLVFNNIYQLEIELKIMSY